MTRRLLLDGAWQVQRVGDDEALPARVPGCIHADLRRAGRIPDPYFRDHERQLQWIGEADWTYRRTFTVPATFGRAPVVRLCCDGLDTLATVCLNGHVVARADNMYRPWAWDVGALLREGANTLEITFASPLPVMARAQRERRTLPEWHGPLEPAGRGWIRKQPSNFGWDWGPVLITAGIWRSIYLEAVHAARIADVHVQQTHAPEGAVRLQVFVAAEVVRDAALRARCTLRLDGDVVASAEGAMAAGEAEIGLDVPRPRLWWPRGMGDQPLYAVELELVDGSGAVHDAWRRAVGLRTLRLVRQPDAWGESFHFEANGVPFFAKGANWIPADALITEADPARVEALLEAAAAAHFNMVRVWGGGVYETDAFYDACDRLGLCVWQDFMFACSAYPASNDAFLESVEAEAEAAVRRLRHHACLALWCGNNEIEQGLAGDAWTDAHMAWDDYDRLFNGVLPRVVEQMDPERSYWPGSPHTPGNRAHFNDPTRGDAHLWDVWHGRQPFEWYQTAAHRFCSEFGFQSFPEPRTVSAFTRPEDRNVTSYVMEQHQRSGAGNALILHYLLAWFRLPTAFEATLWLSQMLQGLAIQSAVEHWRRSMPRAMGTLYWQLNDCWPVASWSSVDYYGRWKALHHFARRFYAPLLVSGVAEEGRVTVHATSDRRAAARCTLRWTLTTAAGEPLDAGTHAADVPAQSSHALVTLDVSRWLEARGPRDVLLWLALHEEDAEETVSENLVLFARPKHLELEAPGIAHTITPSADGGFAVTLAASRTALWVWLTLTDADAHLSDNFFHLRPGQTRCIHLRPRAPMRLEAVQAQLRVQSLVDTYAPCR